MRHPATALLATVLALLAVTATALAATTDKQRAQKAIVVLSDLPKGWKSSKPEPGDQAPCSLIQSAKDAASARVGSLDFARSDLTFSQKIYVYRSAAKARAQIAKFDTTAFLKCLKDGMTKAIRKMKPPEGVSYGDVTVYPTAGPKAGDGSTAAGIILDITQNGQTSKAVYVFDFVRVGRALSIELFYGIGSADQAFQQSISKVAAKKIAAALK